jgi:regulator of PEP synthase PpsR (kinase-PPPase family)
VTLCHLRALERHSATQAAARRPSQTDVTGLSIEETAHRVVRLVDRRRQEAAPA